MIINWPTALTLARVAMIPVLVLLLWLLMPPRSPDWLSASVFAAAAITDWVDGWLARRLDQTSPFGAFLDPVADKLMVSSVLVMLVFRDPRWEIALPAVVIVGREITISALREWMAELGQRTHVAVSAMGKYKTATQFVAILLMLLNAVWFDVSLYRLGLGCLWLAALLTVWSMAMYLQAAWPMFRASNPRKPSA
jgi:CDP-diacylglycerol--glycerol-3-phosphate 3-phosphatidyltransferase/cardiolipin synthase